MPLSWNDIRANAIAFSKEWADESSERSEAKTFWDDFFRIFGITRRRLAAFEDAVKKDGGDQGFIDLFWKGVLIVEHKSRGRSLDKAYGQAIDYFPGIKERDLPRYILVSDFARFRLYDLEAREEHEFSLKELHKNIKRFAFIAGYETRSFGKEDAVNIKAAEQLGKLHDQLREVGYEGHPLEVFLVRILFCLFADDTGIFEQRGQFREYIEQRTAEDGSDMGALLAQLFQVLNTPREKRHKTLDEHLAAFAYVDGKLFEENLPIASFNRKMRETLLDCSGLDWSRISPAIFGSLFQSIMDKKARRNLGAHYTREVNILKALQPLFLDELRRELEQARRSPSKLRVLQKKLSTIRVLDPACGCGNFLVIAYREMREIELEILRELRGAGQSLVLDVSHLLMLDVDQFYGIEIEEFPAQIAQVALWLTDHQMNVRVSEEFGQYFTRLPLKKAPNIVHGNALALDWRTVIAPTELSYIVGNPPFVGKQLQSAQQKRELMDVFRGVNGSGVLDYVSAWYAKAADMLDDNQRLGGALVSTNSITQGEQVGILWPYLLSRGIHINFAHRTFQWTSEARGKAAVHCVIIGFSKEDAPNKTIFEYVTPKSEPVAIKAKNISPYLVDAANIILNKRSAPICTVPSITFGNMANDGGNLLLSDDERAALLREEPAAKKWVRPFMQVDELLYGKTRWCLWLGGITPAELRALPLVSARVHAVREYREQSERETTRELARYPQLFGEIRQPHTDYFIVPRHTGEDRLIIPIAKFPPSVICGDANLLIDDPSLYVFGTIQSVMHMAWVRSVCGRIKSDYRYSAGIVYNNFPWPEPTEKQRGEIERAAQSVLDVRAKFTDSTLADLYDPELTPPELTKAHRDLDRVVDAAYGKTNFGSEAERVAFLFERYEKLAAPLASEAKGRRKVKSDPSASTATP